VSGLASNKKSVVRSFRLSAELCEELEAEAEREEVTLNALVTNVLTKYVRYDRHMNKLQYIPLPKKVIEMLVEATGEDFLRQIAYNFGKVTLRNEVDVWPASQKFDDLLEFFAVRMKYGGVGNVYINKEGEEYTVVLRHTLGEKFSKAWGWFFKGFMDSFYEDVDPVYTYAEDQLTITLRAPERRVRSQGNLNNE
jgi:hypothetical protein